MRHRSCLGHGRHAVRPQRAALGDSGWGVVLRGCGWGIVLLASAGCSSGAESHSQTQSAQLQQLCVSICSKAAQCADGGATASACNSDCMQPGAQGTGLAADCNVTDLVVAENACLQDSCATYGSCIEQAATNAACTTTGSASTSADGGASCSQCDQAGTCCSALEAIFGTTDASDCAGLTTAACNAAGAQSGAFAEDCQLQLIVGQDYHLATCEIAGVSTD